MDREEFNFTNVSMLRKKAEAKMKVSEGNVHLPQEETEIQMLVTELQMRQIELEMQNEELRNAYETASAALKRYALLYDLVPVGYFTLDYDASIVDLNYTGAEMLRERRISLIHSNFKFFVSEDSLPLFDDFFKRIYSSHTKESCELLLEHDKIPLCYVYMEGVVTGDDQMCLLTLINIINFK